MSSLDVSLERAANTFAYDRALTVPTAFAQAAQRYPEKEALACGDARYTYAALDSLTNQLARRLIAAGVTPGSIVATLTERSADTVIAWLAINKCGAAYLPYDPAYPMDTLRFMIEDAKPVLALADNAFDRAAAGELGAPILSLEAEIEAAAASGDAAAVEAPVEAGQTCYVMYTSGSTGKPKGVIVPHRGVVRLVRDQNYMDFTADETWLLASALAFDLSTLEVWGALLNGGKCAVLGGARFSIDYLAETIQKQGVTAMWLTSGLFNAIVDENVMALRGLETLLVGGDVVSPEHANKFIAAFPQVQFVNGYGPTEATTFTACWRAPLGQKIEGSVPIGISLAHSTTMILDEELAPVPNGETGFLWAGGDGVALGYLNREELTADRFRPDPQSTTGGVMYNTGDLARLLPDGMLEFLGRKDRQLKIDGKRIELDEVEHNLRADERIDDAVVALRQEGVVKTVVGFIKLQDVAAGEAGLEAVLSDYRARMPAHMTPHMTLLVEEFPLTPNGKMNRKALLAMADEAAAGAASAPRTLDNETEAAIAAVWSEVLGHQNFGRDENFFDIGGTSLLMMKAHVTLQKKLDRKVPITVLFAQPRIAELAQALNGADATSAKRRAAKDRGARQKDLLRRMRS